MIELTRLNGQRMFVNSDLVQYAETSPDTVLTLLNGDKIMVRESCEEVRALMMSYRVSVLNAAWPGAAPAWCSPALLHRAEEDQPEGEGEEQ